MFTVWKCADAVQFEIAEFNTEAEAIDFCEALNWKLMDEDMVLWDLKYTDMTHETKPCDVCGRQVLAGMTDDYGDIHVCEDCFEKYMDDTYGKHCWMGVNDDFCGGYYIVRDDSVVGGYVGTGIYYTTFDWEG